MDAMGRAVYVVNIYGRHDEEDGGRVWWVAKGGIEDDSSGTDYDTTPDLRALVEQVRDEVQGLRERYDLEIRWVFHDDEVMDALLSVLAPVGPGVNNDAS